MTHYEVLEAFGKATLVEVHLETGRTHQIRVHFSALRHPCAGDLTYGGADPRLAANLGLTRQWLHARQLGFTHPPARAIGLKSAATTRRTFSTPWICSRQAPHRQDSLPGSDFCRTRDGRLSW